MTKAHMIADGGGGAAKIEISVDDITLIFKQIESILNEFETTIVPNIEQLKGCHFYTSGKAQKAMDVFQEANEKTMEVYTHYSRASTLVIETLNKMIEMDEAIAMQIFEGLDMM